MNDTILKDARANAERMTEWRRHLHAHPELSGREVETARFVAERLSEMGYEPRERVGGAHGLTAELSAGDGPFIALRADMDALPIDEQNDVEYRSTNPGVMHACGHDAHTAMLLGAAQILSKRRGQLKQPVRFIFQPAEEQFPGGAAPMIEAGVLNDVSSILGIHVWSQLPIGVLGTRVGSFMASVNVLNIRVIGRGGHAASPQLCIDPIVAAAQVILALQTVVSRSISLTDSAVVSVTQINGGTADNVIPEYVSLCGTIRTLDEEVREKVCARVRQVAEGAAAALGATAEVDIRPGYPVVVNHPEATTRALTAARSLGLDDEHIRTLDPIGGGEDFAYYCEKIPGAFVFLGAGNSAKGCEHAHHHPRFNIDEDVLPLGAALHAQYCLNPPAAY